FMALPFNHQAQMQAERDEKRISTIIEGQEFAVIDLLTISHNATKRASARPPIIPPTIINKTVLPPAMIALILIFMPSDRPLNILISVKEFVFLSSLLVI